jgi:hypothetical protein
MRSRECGEHRRGQQQQEEIPVDRSGTSALKPLSMTF